MLGECCMCSYSLCVCLSREDILEAVERLKKEFGSSK